MGILNKVFKSDNYYLELDEAGEKKAQIAKSEPVKEVVETTTKVETTTTDVVSDKSQSDAAKEAQPAQPAKTIKSAGASSYEPPFWVAAMYNNNSSGSDDTSSSSNQSEQTFATDNLMPIITKSRRRPGPSLNPFRDMAKQAKTPKR